MQIVFDHLTIALENLITPIAKVKIAASKITHLSLTDINKEAHIQLGKTMFESKCILGHKHGVAGAPRLGNKSDWVSKSKKTFHSY